MGKVGAASAGGYAKMVKALPLFYMTVEDANTQEHMPSYRATIYEGRHSYGYFSQPPDKPPEASPKYA